jgi:hypothetical protein
MLEVEERRRETSKKPRKYQICMKTSKCKMVNTRGTKRPKYSLKKRGSLQTQIANR